MGVKSGGFDISDKVTGGPELAAQLQNISNTVNNAVDSLNKLVEAEQKAKSNSNITLKFKANYSDVDKANKIIEEMYRKTKTPATIKIEATGEKEINPDHISRAEQLEPYYKSIDSARNAMIEKWNGVIEHMNSNGIESMESMISSKNPLSTGILRYANAFEALGGDIQSVSQDLKVFIDLMRDIPELQQINGNSFTVDNMKQVFSYFRRLQDEAGAIFEGFADKDNLQIEPKQFTFHRQGGGGTTGATSSFGGASQASSAAADEAEASASRMEDAADRTEAAAERTTEAYEREEKAYENIEQLRLRAFARKTGKHTFYDNYDFNEEMYHGENNSTGYNHWATTLDGEIESYQEALKKLQELQDEALNQAKKYQTEYVDAYNMGDDISANGFLEQMQGELDYYNKYADAIEYIQKQLQDTLINFKPGDEWGSNEIQALISLLQQLYAEIQKISSAFGEVDKENGIDTLLSQLHDIGGDISNAFNPDNIESFSSALDDVITKLDNISKSIGVIGEGKTKKAQQNTYSIRELMQKQLGKTQEASNFIIDVSGDNVSQVKKQEKEEEIYLKKQRDRYVKAYDKVFEIFRGHGEYYTPQQFLIGLQSGSKTFLEQNYGQDIASLYSKANVVDKYLNPEDQIQSITTFFSNIKMAISEMLDDSIWTEFRDDIASHITQLFKVDDLFELNDSDIQKGFSDWKSNNSKRIKSYLTDNPYYDVYKYITSSASPASNTKNINKRIAQNYGLGSDKSKNEQEDLEQSDEGFMDLMSHLRDVKDYQGQINELINAFRELKNVLSTGLGLQELEDGSTTTFFQQLIDQMKRVIETAAEMSKVFENIFQIKSNQNTQGKSVNPDDVIYHSGILSRLNKADTLGKQTADRGTGYFGTGHYFTDRTLKNTPSGIGGGSGYYDRPFSSVDISYYDNLYKVKTNEQGKSLHTFLKDITKYAFDYQTDRIDLSELYATFQDLFKKDDVDEQAFRNILSGLRGYASSRTGLDDRRDSVSTKFMKDFGYGGIDARNTRYANNEFGIVIYDLKEESILQANITDELQKQGDMIERIHYAKGEAWNQDEDKRIEKLIEEKKIMQEIQEETNRIHDTKNYDALTKEYDDKLDEIKEINRKLEIYQDRLENPNDAANDFLQDIAKMGLMDEDEIMEKLPEEAERIKQIAEENIAELKEEKQVIEQEISLLEEKIDLEGQAILAAREQAERNIKEKYGINEPDDNADNSNASLTEEASALERIATAASAAAKAKSQFVEANQNVASSTSASVSSLSEEAKQFEQVAQSAPDATNAKKENEKASESAKNTKKESNTPKGEEQDTDDYKQNLFNEKQTTRFMQLTQLQDELRESGQLTDEVGQRIETLFEELSNVDIANGFGLYDEHLKQFKIDIEQMGETWDQTLKRINKQQSNELTKTMQSRIDNNLGINNGQDVFADFHDKNGNWTGALADEANVDAQHFSAVYAKYGELLEAQKELNDLTKASFKSDEPEQYATKLQEVRDNISRIVGELRDLGDVNATDEQAEQLNKLLKKLEDAQQQERELKAVQQKSADAGFLKAQQARDARVRKEAEESNRQQEDAWKAQQNNKLFESQRNTRLSAVQVLEQQLKDSGKYTEEAQERIQKLLDTLADAKPDENGLKIFDEELKTLKNDLLSMGETWDSVLQKINKSQGKEATNMFNERMKEINKGMDEVDKRTDRFKPYHDKNGNWTGALAEEVNIDGQTSTRYDAIIQKQKELLDTQNELNGILQEAFKSENVESFNEQIEDLRNKIMALKGEIRDLNSDNFASGLTDKEFAPIDKLEKQIEKAERKEQNLIASQQKATVEAEIKQRKAAIEAEIKEYQELINTYVKIKQDSLSGKMVDVDEMDNVLERIVAIEERWNSTTSEGIELGKEKKAIAEQIAKQHEKIQATGESDTGEILTGAAETNIIKKEYDKVSGKLKKMYDATDWRKGGWVEAVDDLNKRLSNVDLHQPYQQVLADLQEIEQAAQQTSKSIDFQPARENWISSTKSNLLKWMDQNKIAAKEYKEQLDEIIEDIDKVETKGEAAKVMDRINDLQGQAAQSGLLGKSLGDRFKDQFKNTMTSLATYYLSFQDFIRYGREAIKMITELDTQLTEMRKVSDESLSTLQAYQLETFDIANRVGTTAAQIQKSTADWLRLGEKLPDAKKSAEYSTLLMNVSEFESINEATESLVAMSQAYQDLDKIDIIDKLNNIGNNFSISTSELAESLQRSAGTLKVAGNSLDEAIALTVAGNQVLQNPQMVGQSLRTISLRLTGTSVEDMQEAGEEIDGLITTQSKLRKTIMDITRVESNGRQGFDILDEKGNYKSTYEMLKGIAKVWKEIGDEDKKMGTNRQSLLLETIAGKTRAAAASSILDNFETLQEVYEKSLMSEGSAQEELDKYLDSIQGKAAQFQNELQKLASSAIDNSWIKGLIDLGTELLGIVNELGGAFGHLSTIIGTGLGIFMQKTGKGILPTEKGKGWISLLENMFAGKPPVATVQKTITQPLTEEYADNLSKWVKMHDFDMDRGFLDQMLGEGYTLEQMKTGDMSAYFGSVTNELTQAELAAIKYKEAIQLATTGTAEISKTAAKSMSGFEKLSQGILSFASTALTTFAMTAVVAVIGKGIEYLWNEIVKKRENLIREGKEAQNQINDIRDSLKEKTDFQKDSSERFIKLRAEVDPETNKNISLTNEQYEEYISLANQVAEIYPSVVTSYDEQGNAILNLSNNIETATEQMANFLEMEKLAANIEINKNLDAEYLGALEQMAEYDEKIAEKRGEAGDLEIAAGVFSGGTDSLYNQIQEQLKKAEEDNEAFTEFTHQIKTSDKDYLDLWNKVLKDSKYGLTAGEDYEIWAGKDSAGNYLNNIKLKDTGLEKLISTNQLETFSKELSEVNFAQANIIAQKKSEVDYELSSLIKEQEGIWQALIPDFIDSLGTNPNYDQLTEDIQNGISQAIQGVKPENIDLDENQKLGDWIKEKYLYPISNIFNNAETSEEAKAASEAMSKIFSIDESKMKVSDYKDQMSGYLDTLREFWIKTMGAEKGTAQFQEFISDFGFGELFSRQIGPNLEMQTIVTQVDETIKSIKKAFKDGLTDDEVSQLGELTIQQLFDLDKLVNNKSFTGDFTKAIKQVLENVQKDIKPEGVLSDLFGDETYSDTADKYEKNLSSLTSALSSIRTEGELTFEQMRDLQEEFSNITDFSEESIGQLAAKELGDWTDEIQKKADELDFSPEGMEQLNTYLENLILSYGDLGVSAEQAMEAVRSSVADNLYKQGLTGESAGKVIDTVTEQQIDKLEQTYGKDLNWEIVWMLALEDKFSDPAADIEAEYQDLELTWRIKIEADEAVAEIQKNIDTNNSRKQAIQAANSYYDQISDNNISVIENESIKKKFEEADKAYIDALNNTFNGEDIDEVIGGMSLSPLEKNSNVENLQRLKKERDNLYAEYVSKYGLTYDDLLTADQNNVEYTNQIVAERTSAYLDALETNDQETINSTYKDLQDALTEKYNAMTTQEQDQMSALENGAKKYTSELSKYEREAGDIQNEIGLAEFDGLRPSKELLAKQAKNYLDQADIQDDIADFWDNIVSDTIHNYSDAIKNAAKENASNARKAATDARSQAKETTEQTESYALTDLRTNGEFLSMDTQKTEKIISDQKELGKRVSESMYDAAIDAAEKEQDNYWDINNELFKKKQNFEARWKGSSQDLLKNEEYQNILKDIASNDTSLDEIIKKIRDLKKEKDDLAMSDLGAEFSDLEREAARLNRTLEDTKKDATAVDYIKAIANNFEQELNLREQIAELNQDERSQYDPKSSGYQEWASELSSLEEQLYSTTQAHDQFVESLLSLPLKNIAEGIEEYSDALADLEGKQRVNAAKGIGMSEADYAANIQQQQGINAGYRTSAFVNNLLSGLYGAMGDKGRQKQFEDAAQEDMQNYYSGMEKVIQDQKSKAELPMTTTSKELEELQRQEEILQSNFDQLESKGFEITEKSYSGLIANLDQQIEKQRALRDMWLTARDAMEANGMMYNADGSINEIWAEYDQNYTTAVTAYESLMAKDREYKEQIANLPITRLQNQLSDLQTQATDVNDLINLNNTKGVKPTVKQYEKLAKNSRDQAKNLRTQNSLLSQQASTLDKQGEKYRNIADQIRSNASAIRQAEADAISFDSQARRLITSQVQDLASAISSALSETVTKTGLTNDTIDSLITGFEDVAGRDVSNLFYRTAEGVKLDVRELQNLAEAQSRVKQADFAAQIDKQKQAIADYQNQIGQGKTNEHLRQMNSDLQDLLRNQAMYFANYVDMMKQISNLGKIALADSTENQGANYDKGMSYLKEAKEMWDKGLIGTDDFKARAAYFNAYGFSDPETFKADYDKISKYMTDDITGFDTFMHDLVTEGLAHIDDETGAIIMDFQDMEDAAMQFKDGVGKDWFIDMFGKGAEYGADFVYASSLEDAKYQAEGLRSELLDAKLKYAEMMESGKPQEALEKQQEIIQGIEDKLINVNRLATEWTKADTTNFKEGLVNAGKTLDYMVDQYNNATDEVTKGRWLEEIQATADKYKIKIDIEAGEITIDQDSYNQALAEAGIHTPETALSYKEVGLGDQYEKKQVYENLNQGLYDLLSSTDPEIQAALNTVSQYTAEQLKSVDLINGGYDNTTEKGIALESALDTLNDALGTSKENAFLLAYALQGMGLTNEPQNRTVEMPEQTQEQMQQYREVATGIGKFAAQTAVAIGSMSKDNPVIKEFSTGIIDKFNGFKEEATAIINQDHKERRETEYASITESIGKLSEDLTPGFDNVVNAIGEAASIVAQAINPSENNTNTSLPEPVKQVVNKASEVGGNIGSAVQNIGNHAVDFIAKFIPDMSEVDSVEVDNKTAEVDFEAGSDESVQNKVSEIENTPVEKKVNFVQGAVSFVKNLFGGNKQEETQNVESTNTTTYKSDTSQLESGAEKAASVVNSVPRQHTTRFYGIDTNASSTASAVTTAVNAIPQSKTTTVSMPGGADVVRYASSIKTAIDNIPTRKDVIVHVTKQGELYTGTMSAPAKASGTAYNVINTIPVKNAFANGKVSLDQNEEALVNELGTESIIRDGRWFLIPGGMHVESLKKGDIVLNHLQTEELIKTGKAFGTGKAYARGTAFNGMPSHATNVGKATYKGPQGGANPNNNDTKKTIQTAGSQVQKAGGQAEQAAAKTETAFEKLQKWLGTFQDWIEVRINRLTTSIDRFTNKAESIDRTYQDKNADIDKAMAQISSLENYNKTLLKTTAVSSADGAVTEIAKSVKLTESKEYKDEKKRAKAAGVNVDNPQTVYGNIDTNNRSVITWNDKTLKQNKKALQSIDSDAKKNWKKYSKQMKGSTSTVMGSSSNYGGVEVAYSPILQKNGKQAAKVLNQKTIDKYMNTLISNVKKEKKNWTTEDLLAADAKGIKIGKTLVKGLIADAGTSKEDVKRVRKTAEQMHYTGQYGSLAQTDSTGSGTLLVDAQRGAVRYQKQADRIADEFIKEGTLSKAEVLDIVNKIQTGKIDIEEYKPRKVTDSEGKETEITPEKDLIQAYTEMFEKSQDCIDKTIELKAQMKELQQTKLDNIVEQYESLASYAEAISSRSEAMINLNTSQGKVVNNANTKELMREQIKQQNKLANYYKEEADAYAKEMKNAFDIFGEDSNEYRAAETAYEGMQEAMYNAQAQALDLNKALLELDVTKAEYAINRIQSLVDRIAGLVGLKEKRGTILDRKRGLVGVEESDYNDQILMNNQVIVETENKRNKLRAELAGIDPNIDSAHYDEVKGKIDDCDKAILNMLSSNEDLKKSIRDWRWKPFEDAQVEIKNTISDLEHLKSLNKQEQLFDTETGTQLTAKGYEQIGLIAMQMDQSQKTIANYRGALEKLEQEYKNGNINLEEYKEQSRQFTEIIQGAVTDVEKYKDELTNLYITQITNENNELQKLIKARKDALSAKKAYYDYDKQLKNSNKEVNNLKAQIAALSGVTLLPIIYLIAGTPLEINKPQHSFEIKTSVMV